MKKIVLHSSSSHSERHLVNRPFSSPICFSTPVLLLHLSWTPPKFRPGWYGPYNACLLWRCWISYQCSATPIVYVVAVANEFVLPVHLNVCSALSSDHMPVLKTSHVERPSKILWVALNSLECTGPPQDSSLVNPVVIHEEVMDKPAAHLDGAIHEAWF